MNEWTPATPDLSCTNLTPHPKHRWMFARHVLQCPGVESYAATPAEAGDPLAGSGELAWDVQQQNPDGTWSPNRIDYDASGWDPDVVAAVMASTLAEQLSASTVVIGDRDKVLRVRVWDAARGNDTAQTATIGNGDDESGA